MILSRQGLKNMALSDLQLRYSDVVQLGVQPSVELPGDPNMPDLSGTGDLTPAFVYARQVL